MKLAVCTLRPWRSALESPAGASDVGSARAPRHGHLRPLLSGGLDDVQYRRWDPRDHRFVRANTAVGLSVWRGCPARGATSAINPGRLRGRVDVQLTWENPGNVSEFEFQVGFAPNAPVLSHRVGLETSVSVANVPPGVYYLRVRAINEIGKSPASPEIRVVVN